MVRNDKDICTTISATVGFPHLLVIGLSLFAHYLPRSSNPWSSVDIHEIVAINSKESGFVYQHWLPNLQGQFLFLILNELKE